MNGVAAAVSAAVLVVVVSGWPAAALIAAAAVVVDRWHSRSPVRHRCGCEDNGPACSHISATLLAEQPGGDR